MSQSVTMLGITHTYRGHVSRREPKFWAVLPSFSRCFWVTRTKSPLVLQAVRVKDMTYFPSLRKMGQTRVLKSPRAALWLAYCHGPGGSKTSRQLIRRLHVGFQKSAMSGWMSCSPSIVSLTWTITRPLRGILVISRILKSSALYLCKITIGTESAIGLEIVSVIITGCT